MTSPIYLDSVWQQRRCRNRQCLAGRIPCDPRNYRALAIDAHVTQTCQTCAAELPQVQGIHSGFRLLNNNFECGGSQQASETGRMPELLPAVSAHIAWIWSSQLPFAYARTKADVTTRWDIFND